MQARKRYWTEAFVVTILISAIFGFVAGRKFCIKPNTAVQNSARDAKLPQWAKRADSPCLFSRKCSCFFFEDIHGPVNNPLVQPNALLIASSDAQFSGTAAHWNVRTLICEQGAGGCGKSVRLHKNAHGITDATPIAIMLPILVIGSLITLRKKLF